MIEINTHNEWDPLKEIVVGDATGAQVPTVKDHCLRCIEYAVHDDEQFANIPTGPYPKHIVDETNEDLQMFCDDLEKLGIRVHRPQAADFSERYTTEDWSVDGYHVYCPRDPIFTVGNQAIETPMTLRHRQNEARLYRHIMPTVESPRPRLLDSMYDRSKMGVPTLMNHEPAFDAANCLKMGRDILYLVSNTGNDAGLDWLQQHLGPDYRVHPVRDVYVFIHIDSTITLLRPGLVLLCPDRVKDESALPPCLQKWEKIYAPEPVPIPADDAWNPASKWISMNCLSLSPDLVVVEKSQTNLMRLMESKGIDVLPMQLRHTRTLGGGPHCVTLDLVREGTLEDYS